MNPSIRLFNRVPEKHPSRSPFQLSRCALPLGCHIPQRYLQHEQMFALDSSIAKTGIEWGNNAAGLRQASFKKATSSYSRRAHNQKEARQRRRHGIRVSPSHSTLSRISKITEPRALNGRTTR